MVKRVWGHVEGVDIIFTPSNDDVWVCSVPPVPDGEYVVDLYAEDDSGNVSYAATVLFTINARHLIFTVKVINRYRVESRVRNFTMNVIRCEVCGGDMYTTN